MQAKQQTQTKLIDALRADMIGKVEELKAMLTKHALRAGWNAEDEGFSAELIVQMEVTRDAIRRLAESRGER